jgi:PIN domain nuclease of toxin-antitoxin system
VSAVVAWEVAIKVQLGKLRLPKPPAAWADMEPEAQWVSEPPAPGYG